MLILELLYFISLLLSVLSISEIIYKTGSGPVRGKCEFSRNGTEYVAVYNIPYAQPPVGPLRFQAPADIQPWTEIRNCTVDRHPKCTQTYGRSIRGREDCLYLNVYTPCKNISRCAKSCVIVYFHGGYLYDGSSSSKIYGVNYFMDYKITMVVANQRLGRLAFLSLEDEVLPGNYAYKDQVQVLKWVNKYISDFGGDPNCVTIAGHGATAVGVGFHLISKLSEGLFHRAISLSGTPLSPVALPAFSKVRNRTISFALENGCPVDSSENTASCFRKLPVTMFFDTMQEEIAELGMTMPLALGTVREPATYADAFLTISPFDYLSNVTTKVPRMITMNSGEDARYCNPLFTRYAAYYQFFNSSYRMTWPTVLGYRSTVPTLGMLNNVTEIIRNMYLTSSTLTFQNCVDILTDFEFVWPIRREAELYNGGPVYVLYNEYIPTATIFRSHGNQTQTAPEFGDDVSLLFKGYYSSEPLKGTDLSVSNELVSKIVNFTIYGNPNGYNCTDETWKPSTESEFLHLYPNGTSAMDSKLRQSYYAKISEIHIINDI